MRRIFLSNTTLILFNKYRPPSSPSPFYTLSHLLTLPNRSFTSLSTPTSSSSTSTSTSTSTSQPQPQEIEESTHNTVTHTEIQTSILFTNTPTPNSTNTANSTIRYTKDGTPYEPKLFSSSSRSTVIKKFTNLKDLLDTFQVPLIFQRYDRFSKRDDADEAILKTLSIQTLTINLVEWEKRRRYGDVLTACKVLVAKNAMDTVQKYEILLSALVSLLGFEEALFVLKLVKAEFPDQVTINTFNNVLKMLEKGKHLQVAQSIQRMIVDLGMQPNIFTYTSVIKVAFNASHLHIAQKYWQDLKDLGLKPNIDLINTFIQNGSTSKQCYIVEEALAAMIEHKILIGYINFLDAINTILLHDSRIGCKRIMEYSALTGIPLNTGVLESMLDTAYRVNDANLASQVWTLLLKVSNNKPSTRAHRSRVVTFSVCSKGREFILALNEMALEGHSLSLPLLRYLLPNCFPDVEKLDQAYYDLEDLKKSGKKVSVEALNSIVLACSIKKDMERAWATFEEYPSFGIPASLETYRSLIIGAEIFGDIDMAFGAYERLVASGLGIDPPSFETLVLVVLNSIKPASGSISVNQIELLPTILDQGIREKIRVPASSLIRILSEILNKIVPLDREAPPVCDHKTQDGVIRLGIQDCVIVSKVFLWMKELKYLVPNHYLVLYENTKRAVMNLRH